MGAYLSNPITEKMVEDGLSRNLKFGASSMQGWRISQEVLDFIILLNFLFLLFFYIINVLY